MFGQACLSCEASGHLCSCSLHSCSYRFPGTAFSVAPAVFNRNHQVSLTFPNSNHVARYGVAMTLSASIRLSSFMRSLRAQAKTRDALAPILSLNSNSFMVCRSREYCFDTILGVTETLERLSFRRSGPLRILGFKPHGTDPVASERPSVVVLGVFGSNWKRLGLPIFPI